MKPIVATAMTSATPAQVWTLYADPATWPRWDADVEGVIFNGPFAAGTTGVLRPKGGPPTQFRFKEVVPQQQFRNVAAMPLCRLSFEHTLTARGAQTLIRHEVTFQGPLAWLWVRIIGPNIAKGLPQALSTLAQLATHVNPPVS